MMEQKVLKVKHFTNVILHRANRTIRKDWQKWFIFFVAIFWVWQRDFSIHIQFYSKENAATHLESKSKESLETTKQITKGKTKPNYQQYIKDFAAIAQTEMRKFRIPASITLAQGLLESNGGKSPLASKSNNHFGIKCFSKRCAKGHCTNFSDDSHKDFFIKYKSAWESYRAHSLFLQKDRYKHLLKLAPSDYKAWAYGLKKAGYATDPKYPEKLIRLIKTYKLDQFDQP